MAQSPDEYAASHLAHELDCMLIAATTWAACHPDARRSFPFHLDWTAEYAAFLHQRNLFEFFCEHDDAIRKVRRAMGHQDALNSDVWKVWGVPLNTAVAHVWGRMKAGAPVREGVHLKDQVALLSSELIRLWRDFADLASPNTGDVLHAGLDRATERAAAAAEQMGAPKLDWNEAEPFSSWGDRKWWPTGDS